MPEIKSTAKRSNRVITLGSGHIYVNPYSGKIPSTYSEIAAFCAEERRLGYIKGGASLEYSQETYEEKDDFGIVRKIITTSETAVMKFGLITWNGETLKTLIDRCTTIEMPKSGNDADSSNVRVTKIGGGGNAQGGYYLEVFQHVDKIDGDVYVSIVCRNTAGATLSFTMDAGTLIEPEFTAIPSDEDGTLILMFEEIKDADTVD